MWTSGLNYTVDGSGGLPGLCRGARYTRGQFSSGRVAYCVVADIANYCSTWRSEFPGGVEVRRTALKGATVMWASRVVPAPGGTVYAVRPGGPARHARGA